MLKYGEKEKRDKINGTPSSMKHWHGYRHKVDTDTSTLVIIW